jgi:hypothetical protein
MIETHVKTANRCRFRSQSRFLEVQDLCLYWRRRAARQTDQLNNQIHRAITRELTAKGLREVTPEENPDLVVRYFVESQKGVNVSTNTNWGVYGPYYGYHWGFIYYSMETSTTHLGTLGIELIDPHSRDLTWRMFAHVKIIHTEPDKIWKTADSNIKNAFKRYPPSPKDIEEKKQQWAKEDAAKKPSHSQ